MGDAAGTALNVAALLLAVLAIAGSGVTWHLSRANTIRSFETRVFGQLQNAASRIERVESQWLEEKSHLAAISEEMVTAADRTAKERKRLYAENQRAAMVQQNTPQEVDLSKLPRDEQLRHVRAQLGG